jgi:glycerol-3-phosphate acyltransferase PlsX
VIVPAAEWITMDEKAATAIRKKPGSSMRVGLRLVKENKVAGFLTAGNTGAAMALAKMVLGALPGVDRPSLATMLPTSTGSPCVLLDVGANVDCKPHNLEQFAVMGEMYARSVLKIPRPRVGLLSIGEEEGKGNDLTREAFPCSSSSPSTSSATWKAATFTTAMRMLWSAMVLSAMSRSRRQRGWPAWCATCCASRSTPPSPRR